MRCVTTFRGLSADSGEEHITSKPRIVQIVFNRWSAHSRAAASAVIMLQMRPRLRALQDDLEYEVSRALRRRSGGAKPFGCGCNRISQHGTLIQPRAP